MAVTPFKSSDNFNMAGFNEKITEADNTYVAKTGDSMTGALSMGNNKITDVASPTSAGDVATKEYVDEEGTKYLKTIKGTYTGSGGIQVVINYETKPKMIFICSNSKNLMNSNAGSTVILADNDYYISYGIFNSQIAIYTGTCVWENNRIVISGNYLIDYSTIEYTYVMVY